MRHRRSRRCPLLVFCLALAASGTVLSAQRRDGIPAVPASRVPRTAEAPRIRVVPAATACRISGLVDVAVHPDDDRLPRKPRRVKRRDVGANASFGPIGLARASRVWN